MFYLSSEQDELEALAKTLPGMESLKGFKMHPQDFEKVRIIRLTNQKLSILDIFSFQTTAVGGLGMRLIFYTSEYALNLTLSL